MLTIVGSESSKIDPGLAAASIRILGEKLEKTPDEWARKWKEVMPKQAQKKILEGYPPGELIRIKWSEIERQSSCSAGLNILEMFEQEKEPQQQEEQDGIRIGSLEARQQDDDADRYCQYCR